MRGFWETVARDGWAYDLKHETIVVLRCEKRQNLVELIDGAGPAVNEHKRQNLLILAAWWHHMDEVHVQSCNDAKACEKKRKKGGPTAYPND